MSRVRAALVLFVAIGVAALGSLAGAATVGASTPPAAPAPTTVPGIVAPPASPVATTVPPAGSRGGATEGSVVKPGHETWDVQRIIVTTALLVIALAAIGYVYGKLRSAPPRHPDLARQTEDLETTG